MNSGVKRIDFGVKGNLFQGLPPPDPGLSRTNMGSTLIKFSEAELVMNVCFSEIKNAAYTFSVPTKIWLNFQENILFEGRRPYAHFYKRKSQKIGNPKRSRLKISYAAFVVLFWSKGSQTRTDHTLTMKDCDYLFYNNFYYHFFEYYVL